jgi:hypothetical protein
MVRGKKRIAVAADTPENNVRYDANIAVSVAIEGVEILRGKPAIGVLYEMSQVVAKIGGATEAECRRSGIIP